MASLAALACCGWAAACTRWVWVCKRIRNPTAETRFHIDSYRATPTLASFALLVDGSSAYLMPIPLQVAGGKGRSRSLQRQPSGQAAALASAGKVAAANTAGGAVPAKTCGLAAVQPGPSQHAAPGAAAATGSAASSGSGVQRLSRFKLVSTAAAAAAAAAALAAARRRRSSAGKASVASAAGAASATLKPRGGVAKSKSSTVPGAKQLPPRQQRQQTGVSGAGARIVYCPVYCRTGKCERRGKGCPLK